MENVFQIWWMLAGYEELAGEFEPIRGGEIFWIVSLFTHRVATPFERAVIHVAVWSYLELNNERGAKFKNATFDGTTQRKPR